MVKTNAHLLMEMFTAVPFAKDGTVVFVGAGTGQMFDYIGPEPFADCSLLFTDLTARFTAKLEKRLKRFPNLHWQWTQDDIEKSRLIGPFDATVISLVLQHIEWEKGIESVIKFPTRLIYIVMQWNEQGGHAVTKSRDLTPSMEEFSMIANPVLVPEENLTEKLKTHKYEKITHLERPVPDHKTMRGLVYKLKD